MFKRKSNAFTLIELIATLVIMAIIALIVTPLVMNIIRKARVSADKRSVDAYGRSIELAIASYLLDTGKFATSIDELTIEYSGNKVECETTQINPDSSVYLSNCKVNNREVTNYTYGADKSLSYEAYSVGDEVTYNGVDYYVLKDSGVRDNVVTLLKATPLTTDEVNLYGGVGTANNHVNQNTSESVGVAKDLNGYGLMAYYSSIPNYCGASYAPSPDVIHCTTDYNESEIKYVVDAWVDKKVIVGLKEARLVIKEEIDSLGYSEQIISCGGGCQQKINVISQQWMYNEMYSYWTMSSAISNHNNIVWRVISSGSISDDYQVTQLAAVRPVVELYKNDGITRKNSGNN